MPRVGKLTAKSLREALRQHGPASPDRSYYLMERPFEPDTLRGFGVRVFRSHASYVVRWRGRTHTVADISHLSPEQARDEARTLLQRLQGFATTDGPQASSVDALFTRYLSEWSGPRKAAKTAKQDKRYAEEAAASRVRVSPRSHALVRFGALDVRAVEPHHIAEMHAARTEKRVAANRLVSFLSHAFNKAEDWGLRPRNSNPVDTEPYEEAGRERVFTRAEWKRIGETLPTLFDAAPDAQVLALYAIAYTGARPGEVVAWEIAWLNRELCAVVQPRHKGARRHHRHKGKTVFLPENLLRDLLALKRKEGEDRYVFPGRTKGTHAQPGLRPAWTLLRKRAELGDATLTTFRHSIQTEMPEAGIPVQYTPGLAGHASIETGQRHYMHASDGVLRRAADTLHGHVTGLLGKPPHSRKRGAKKATPRPRKADSG